MADAFRTLPALPARSGTGPIRAASTAGSVVQDRRRRRGGQLGTIEDGVEMPKT